jgi:PAS domain S-box-containing protein
MVTLKRLSIPTVLAVIALIILLNISNLHTDRENRTLLMVLNTLFIGIVPIIASITAADTYLNKKMAGAFLMSCGLLILGLGAISSACLRLLGSTDNASATVFNICAFASALLHLFAANRYQYSVIRHQNGLATIIAMFAAAVGFVFAVIITACFGLLPVFIDKNVSTAIRHAVMFTAIAFFFAAFLVYFQQYKKRCDDFFYWYALSLLMLAVGLLGVTIAEGVGSISSWAGRLAQYVAGCFALLSMVTVYQKARGANQKTAEIMAEFFSNPEESYQNLVNSSTEPILSVDEQGRILLYNPSTISLFRLKEAGVANSSVYALLAQPDAERLRADITIFKETGCSTLVGQTVELTATDTFGKAFPIEASISGRRLIDTVVVTLIIRDITMRRKHDEALIREERYARTLVEELRKAEKLKKYVYQRLIPRNPESAVGHERGAVAAGNHRGSGRNESNQRNPAAPDSAAVPVGRRSS